MPSHPDLANLAKSAWRLSVQPALFARNRSARYAAAGIATAVDLPVVRIDPLTGQGTCEARCAYTERLSRGHLQQYRDAHGSWHWRPWLGTACIIALNAYASHAAYTEAVGRRTGKAFHRSLNKARRLGYVTRFFPPDHLQTSIAGILRSKLMRSGGIVPYRILPSSSPPADLGLPARYRPAGWCPLHWKLHFGVFLPPAAATSEIDMPRWQLVGYVKIRRMGSLVHALQIMGHGDHLAGGINDLMQIDLMQWLFDDPDGLAGGVTHYMYGAIEHAGEGLANWKIRRGFRPVLLDVMGTGPPEK